MRFENLGMDLELWTLGLGFEVRNLGIGVVFEIANFGVGLRHTVDFGNVTSDPFKVKKNILWICLDNSVQNGSVQRRYW